MVTMHNCGCVYGETYTAVCNEHLMQYLRYYAKAKGRKKREKFIDRFISVQYGYGRDSVFPDPIVGPFTAEMFPSP